jgi:hypothetical protein
MGWIGKTPTAGNICNPQMPQGWERQIPTARSQAQMPDRRGHRAGFVFEKPVNVLRRHLHGGRNTLHVEIWISQIVANEGVDTSQMVAFQRRNSLRALPHGAGHHCR